MVVDKVIYAFIVETDETKYKRTDKYYNKWSLLLTSGRQ